MILPSYIPRYDSVDLIDLDSYDYRIVVGDHDGTPGWLRLRELERRVVMFDWLLAGVRKPGRNLDLFGDLAGAFLYSLEAAIQELGEAYCGGGSLDGWLAMQPEYDQRLKGLRTLRHREAHVAPRPVVAGDARAGHTTLTSSADSGHTVAWHFREISRAELNSMRSPKLVSSDLDNWNKLCGNEFALELMQKATAALFRMAGRLGGWG